ncbi:MAG: phenylalanine--tRNA ligase subunit alpha [Candidatus Diapherotrites archaeon]|nr:phenylalanine--tRNA ligase subunit alpha [Candidatus Diapherotrites archaeon]
MPETTLSDIEKSLLRHVYTQRTEQLLETAAHESKMNVDSVRRASAWLEEKDLISVREERKTKWHLTLLGKSELEKGGLIELRLLRALQPLKGAGTLADVSKALAADASESNAALGIAKRNAWITLSKKENQVLLQETGLGENALKGVYAPQQALERVARQEDLSSSEEGTANDLSKRGLIEKIETTQRFLSITTTGFKAAEQLTNSNQKEINVLDAQTLKTRAWKNTPFKKYNLADPVPTLFAGKRQPYIQFLEHIHQYLLVKGFKEMKDPLVTTEFYNFDVLFQPQNHPARQWTDTYQLKEPATGKLPGRKIVQAIKNAHETGGKAPSKGWGYKWNEGIAQRLMPVAHGTAHSARTLTEGIEIPGKYFTIARVYRPDVLDATHLIEFNQLDGFIAGKDLSFRDLLGTLKEFAVEIAHAEKIKFLPDYYPFTEPSVQLNALHPELGWIELGGAGMFRPEIMENLGINAQAIAWGLGIDRLAMFKLGINDIRYLFAEDLNWLRAQPLGV